ncbi:MULTISPECIES: hypothetical protein [Gracilibacillus]|uniref:hypothetical protein n=1 Tax=Gracilibacillus TaxID=74385 RepID=UPI000825E9B3|nr:MULTISPECIES: hypothetical protein [Gracilibacillus]
MSEYKNDDRVEDAPRVNNGQQSEDLTTQQFTETNELYAQNELNRRDEETAAELSADTDFNDQIEEAEQETQMQAEVNMTYGWIGLVLAVVSFFVWPLVMGVAGIVFGIISKTKGADTLGNAAITVSVISLLVSLFFVPF